MKKGASHWGEEATEAFGKLKEALPTAIVVSLPYFFKVFVVDTDASDFGIVVVLNILIQEEHPLAVISRALGPKWQQLSVYGKKLLAVVHTVQRWEQYLTGQLFIVVNLLLTKRVLNGS